MEYPILNATETYRDFIEVFGGYNHNLRINDGEFYDMNNLSSSLYPVLAPRKKRGVYDTPSDKPAGMIWKDSFCYVYVGEDLRLHFKSNEYDYALCHTTIDKDEERTIVSMGAYAIILPDKIYVNTKSVTKETLEEGKDYGYIEASYSSKNFGVKEVTFDICKADGTVYEVDCTNPEKPTEIEVEDAEGNIEKKTIPNGYVWLDTSTTPSSLKIYSETSGMWSSVATTYIKISALGIDKNFEVYDGVKISGIEVSQLEDLNSSMVIYAKGDGYIVVVGVMDNHEVIQELTDEDGNITHEIKVERLMPTLDFVVESNNRLWGCHYGINDKGEPINEIYACKQGDFKNWNCFLGIATDSYYASLGTDGVFTGAISYLGMPTFFKENCIHTVYGDYPATYKIQDIACRGVQRGSHKSLAMVNEVLYYKSRDGICAYNGSLPTDISSVLGEKSYSSAIGCSHKNKYYVSMKDLSTEKFDMFIYDTNKGLWHKEEDFEVKAFCPVDEEIYYITPDGTTIGTLFGTGTIDESPVKWKAETGILGCTTPDKKYVSRISVRLMMDIGTKVVFSIQYDSSGDFIPVCTCVGHNLRTFTLPIRPKRCDHFRLRIEGTGDAKIFSISKTIEQGSEL